MSSPGRKHSTKPQATLERASDACLKATESDLSTPGSLAAQNGLQTAAHFTREAILAGWKDEDQLKLVRRLRRLIDGACPEIRQHAVMECEVGCDSCCYRYVMATPVDVLSIFDHIQSWGAEAKAALVAKLEAYVKQSQPEAEEDFVRFKEPCPLLEDGKCSIYEQRPLSCRAIFSASRISCQSAKASKTSVPSYSLFGELEFAGTCENMTLDGSHTQRLRLAETLLELLKSPEKRRDLVENAASFAKPVERPWRERFVAPPQDNLGEAIRDPLVTTMLDRVRKEPCVQVFRDYTIDTTFRAMTSIVASANFFSEQDERDWWAHLNEAVDVALQYEPWSPREAFWALGNLRLISIGKHEGNVRPLMAKIGKLANDRIAAKIAPDLLEPISTPRKPGRLRIGLLGDFGDKSSSNWSLGWVENFDRKDFEVHVIKVYGAEEAYAFAFKDAADHYHRYAGHPLEIARAIRRLDLDYLVFTDLGDARTLLQYGVFRLARRQATGWGSPFTSGMQTIDDYISSEGMEPEDAQDHYTENLVKLPGHGLYLRRPKSVGDESPDRSYFAIPEGLAVSFPQYIVKWSPAYDHLLKKISDRIENPIVMIQMGAIHEVEGFRERVAPLNINMG